MEASDGLPSSGRITAGVGAVWKTLPGLIEQSKNGSGFSQSLQLPPLTAKHHRLIAYTYVLQVPHTKSDEELRYQTLASFWAVDCHDLNSQDSILKTLGSFCFDSYVSE